MVAEIESLLAQKRDSVQTLMVELRALKRVAFLRPVPPPSLATPVQSVVSPVTQPDPYERQDIRSTFPFNAPRPVPAEPPAQQRPIVPEPLWEPAPPPFRPAVHHPTAVRGAPRLDAPREQPPSPEPAKAPAPFRSLRGGAPIVRNRGNDGDPP